MVPNVEQGSSRRPRIDMEVEEVEADDLDKMNSEDSISPSPSLAHQDRKTRPENPRSSTDPSPAELLQGWFKDKEKQEWNLRVSNSHQRNRSPYSRSHLRSRSSGAALLSAPPMTRAHSMPNPQIPRPLDQSAGVTTSGSSGSLSPSWSQSHSPMRPRSPFKTPDDRSLPPRSPSWFESSTSGSTAIESIQEDSELDITPRGQAPLSHPSPLPIHSSFSRSSSLRRRPASPLHSMANTTSQPQPPSSFPASIIDQNTPINMNPPTVSSSSGSNSPALGPQKYNESFPTLHHYASSSSFSISSIPSTPTSARSRSPSISSLETIEDAPEQESKAIEEERIERLKMAAERAEQGEVSDGEESGLPKRRNGSLDVPRGFGFRTGGGGRERKRWSICGGERRGDLDLETIWED